VLATRRAGVRRKGGAVRAHDVCGGSASLPAVSGTAYKNRSLPNKGQLCTICGLKACGQTELVQLTHGVALWLCRYHASEEFRTKNSGRDFVGTLTRIWASSQMLRGARAKALSAHMRRLNARGRRLMQELPGSYSWKALRNEVEHRAAAGEPVRTIIVDLRARHAHDVADAPSERTIRRWYHDGRWLEDDYRTPLRPGYAGRDVARARRAQQDRAPLVRLRETHAARVTERRRLAASTGVARRPATGPPAAAAPGDAVGGLRTARAETASHPTRAP